MHSHSQFILKSKRSTTYILFFFFDSNDFILSSFIKKYYVLLISIRFLSYTLITSNNTPKKNLFPISLLRVTLWKGQSTYYTYSNSLGFYEAMCRIYIVKTDFIDQICSSFNPSKYKSSWDYIFFWLSKLLVLTL